MNKEEDLKKFDWADIVVFQRQTSETSLKLFRGCKEAGQPVIYEIDDNLFNIPEAVSVKFFYSNERLDILKTFLKEADGVTVSTPPLKEAFQKFNKNVIILPNSVDISKMVMGENKPDRDEIVIGWAGSKTHREDLRICVHALIDIARENPKVKLSFYGHLPEEILMRLSEDKYTFQDFVPFGSYQRMLLTLGWDIGVAPLTDAKFNTYKSNLKFLEYTVAGIPVITSPAVPYTSTIENGKDGVIVKKNRNKEWYRALNMMVKDAELRKRLLGGARKKVREQYSMEKNVELWREAYQGVLRKPVS